jgi:general secretion pathway protein K
LIIVLWTLALLAFITALLVGTGRVELGIANNVVANSVTAAAADGAVSRAIFQLLQPDPEKRWTADGTLHEIAIGDARALVRIQDEAGHINPSLASPELLEALLTITGGNPETAHRLAAAIGTWSGRRGAELNPQRVTAEYRAAGLEYEPPGEPFETLGELRSVLGMTPQIFAAIRPHLSLFAPAEPVATDADPVVRAVIAAVSGPQAAGAAAAARQPDMQTARIVAQAEGPGNARVRRIAVVRVKPLSGEYVILSWNRAGDE